jgi:hypothetical protein
MKRTIVACLCLGLLLVVSPQLSVSQDAKVIKLPPPQTDGGKPLMQALKERRLGVILVPRKAVIQTLSNLLWAVTA